MSHRSVRVYVCVCAGVCVWEKEVRLLVCFVRYFEHLLGVFCRVFASLAVLIAADIFYAELCDTCHAPWPVHPCTPPPLPRMVVHCLCFRSVFRPWLQVQLLVVVTARLSSRPAVCLTIEMSCNKSTSHTHTNTPSKGYRMCGCACVSELFNNFSHFHIFA